MTSPDSPPAALGPHVIGVDLGTSAMKLALVDDRAVVRGWTQRPLTLHLSDDGGAEQDPRQWWDALVACVQDLATQAPDRFAAVQVICCSTQGEGTIPVDAAGEPLLPCLTWLDSRGAQPLRRQFGPRVGPGLDGLSLPRLARWVRRTGGAPSPTGRDQAGHMLWVRDHRPDVYARTRHFMSAVDWLVHRLTGEVVSPVDSILTAWVTDNRQVDAIRYDEDLLADSGIDRALLPRIVRCTDAVGTLTPMAAATLGLPATTQVVAGSMDTSAAAVGAGTVRDRDLHLYVGTSSWLAAHVPYKRTDPIASIASVPCALPTRRLMTATQVTGGGVITWLRENVIEHEDGLTGRSPDEIYPALDRVVRESPPGAGGVLFTPWLSGERSPVADGGLRASWVGMGLRTTRADLVRAVYEGVALNTRMLLGPVRRFLRAPVEEITLVGGAARSQAWPQVFADVLHVPMKVPTDPVAVNARGAAIIGLVGIGHLDFADVPGLPGEHTTYEPDSSVRALHDERYAAFRHLQRRLRPIHRR